MKSGLVQRQVIIRLLKYFVILMFICAKVSTAKMRVDGGSQAPDSASTLSFVFTPSFVDQLSLLSIFMRNFFFS